MRTRPLHRSASTAAFSLVIAAACSPATEPQVASLALSNHEPVLFLTQASRPQAVMEALYQGRVSADAAGCIRLAGPDPATVVWPYGFELDRAGGELRVVAPAGELVGRIGGEFRLGGGEVTVLHDGIDVASAARESAAERCPGRYWIVGDVPGI